MCATRAASSARAWSMTIEILISEVLISSMLMSTSASAWKSVAATPECVFMPTPTTESLAMCS